LVNIGASSQLPYVYNAAVKHGIAMDKEVSGKEAVPNVN